MALMINDEVIIDDYGNINQQGFINHLIETAKLLNDDEADKEKEE